MEWGKQSKKTLIKHFQQRIYLIFIWNNLHFIQKSLENRLKWPWGIRAHLLMKTQVNLLLTFVDMQHQNMLKRQSCIKIISRFFRAPRIQAVSQNACFLFALCAHLDTPANIVYYCEYLVITFKNPGPLIFQKNPGYHFKHLTYCGSTVRPCDLSVQTDVHMHV